MGKMRWFHDGWPFEVTDYGKWNLHRDEKTCTGWSNPPSFFFPFFFLFPLLLVPLGQSSLG